MSRDSFDKALQWANDNHNRNKEQRNSSIMKIIFVVTVIIIVIVVIWIFKTSGKSEKTISDIISMSSSPDKNYIFIDEVTNNIVPMDEIRLGKYQIVS